MLLGILCSSMSQIACKTEAARICGLLSQLFRFPNVFSWLPHLTVRFPLSELLHEVAG